MCYVLLYIDILVHSGNTCSFSFQFCFPSIAQSKNTFLLFVLWNFRSDIWPYSSFLSNSRLRVVLDGKSSQEYRVNAGVLQGSILGPTLFLLYINDLPDDVICNIAIYADDTTLYFKCDQASDLWQQLELQSNLRDTELGQKVAC